jgi:hypothetical protein
MNKFKTGMGNTSRLPLTYYPGILLLSGRAVLPRRRNNRPVTLRSTALLRIGWGEGVGTTDEVCLHRYLTSVPVRKEVKKR